MKIHEYQGKEILKKYGVPIPKGTPVLSFNEAEAAAKALITETENEFVVVKAQIHAGGRGKGGGVKVVKGAAAARDAAAQDPRHEPRHAPDGPEGKKVKRLLIEQGVDIARELYLGMLVDRGTGRVTVMASTEGGMEIEEVAAKTPEKILREAVDPVIGPGRATRRATWPTASGCTARRRRTPASSWRSSTARSSRSTLAGRDQPAGRHQRRATCWRSTARSTSTTTRSSATRSSRRCATSTRRTRPRARPRAATSASSSSTATSAAWSTAPAWRWARWTSSSTTAASRRTSSTSAAAPRRRR